ncbi:hypothetical protein AURDEDRAFT_171213 [Auricularia subglabra TFB-10046 SS5]|uniref:F-box domain-containing protein n=1 Tax=Auricularia subglabra (strain TFB-10046 / SS5) TaxID=717982 RepID=J0DCD2_AURST|nr:hypothetical protein AURDEDRAFT_171213 [Auricularia subglabra TFB-10046 SS5]
MSFAVHDEALRASLRRSFLARSDGVTESAKLGPIVDELKEASYSLLLELVAEWKLENVTIHRLPEEVLALCFALLPFRDRVSASHVSCNWRRISLSYPAIWAHIELGDSLINNTALFKMALGRSGNHPIDIVHGLTFDTDGVIEDSVMTHIHHIRTISYSTTPRPALLSQAAPMLEVLHGSGEHLHIASDFLGGQVGRLRSLHAQIGSFAARCPALGTLTDIAIHVPATAQGAEHFRHLFRFCPVLEVLVLLRLPIALAPFIPTGPAPASLRSVMMESCDAGFDLTAHCAAWQLASRSDITIFQNATAGEDLALIISGALSIDVRHISNSPTSVITALGPGSRRRVIEEHDDPHSLAAVMQRVRSTLADVQALSVPATSLPAFMDVFAVLPELKHLTINLHDDRTAAQSHISWLPWNLLTPLARLPGLRPGLQTLILNVVWRGPQDPPSRRDALDLTAHLRRLMHVGLPPILVKGFAAETLHNLPVPEFPGFLVHFVDQGLFPPACPVLSTVTSLSLDGPSSAESAPTFRHLFRLFSALQSLTLCHLLSQYSQFLPDGPVPASLRRLVLESEHNHYDLSEHYAHWHSQNLSDVGICQFTGPTRHVSQFLSGAVELIIRREHPFGPWKSLIAVCPEGRRRALDFHDAGYDMQRLAETVSSVQTALSDVRSINISAVALSDFVPVIAVLPKLTHLTVTVKPDDNSRDGRNFRWHDLASLAHLPASRPELQSIAIKVVCGKESCTPNASDARALFLHLEAVEPSGLPDIMVKGFPPESVLGIEISQLDGFKVAFETNCGSVNRGIEASTDGVAAPASDLEPMLLSLAHGVTDASQISDTYQELGSAAARILCDLVQKWSIGNDSSRCFPDEVLAAIFDVVPVRDRLVVSHVCRRWRSVALAHPAIWADIYELPRCKDGLALVLMALSRTGKYPVQLSLSTDCDGAPELLSALKNHMDHIEQLSWGPGCESMPLTTPAPLLSEIQGVSLDVPSDFLGGQVSTLTKIYMVQFYLPATCPALSTVTSLELHGPLSEDAAENYDKLFTLFPRLEYLRISLLHGDLADTLPTGPAPRTLQDLYLEGIEYDDYDLMQHYTAWKTDDNLQNVTFAQDCCEIADLGALIGGAVKLVIGEEDDTNRTQIAASGCDGWSRAIGFQDLEDGHAAYVAEMIFDVRESLPDLHTLEIEAAYLAAFLPLCDSWPKLTHLALSVLPAIGDEPAYDWAPLRCLSHVRQHSQSIVAIVIDVKMGPPSADDARTMLAHLSLCDVADILIKGFSNAVIANVETPDDFLTGLGIRFARDEDTHSNMDAGTLPDSGWDDDAPV